MTNSLSLGSLVYIVDCPDHDGVVSRYLGNGLYEIMFFGGGSGDYWRSELIVSWRA